MEYFFLFWHSHCNLEVENATSSPAPQFENVNNSLKKLQKTYGFIYIYNKYRHGTGEHECKLGQGLTVL